jgi:hypothetical protein
MVCAATDNGLSLSKAGEHKDIHCHGCEIILNVYVSKGRVWVRNLLEMHARKGGTGIWHILEWKTTSA